MSVIVPKPYNIHFTERPKPICTSAFLVGKQKVMRALMHSMHPINFHQDDRARRAKHYAAKFEAEFHKCILREFTYWVTRQDVP